jgi:hypothetical protein
LIALTLSKGVKVAALVAASAAVALPVSADAQSSRDRATGGGQIILDPNSQPTRGAFDTLAFTAQNVAGATADAARGQVQVNRRLGDGSQQVKFHGVVECLVVVGQKAYISGFQRGTEDDDDGPVPFELYVVDGGSGIAEREGDQGLLWYGPETEENEPDNQKPGGFTPPQEDELCGIEEDPSSKRPVPALARGNYQVYDAP